MSDKITKSPKIRFAGFTDSWEQRKFSELFRERRDKTKVENEDTLLSCAINGMFLNTELFGHFRGSSTIGYLKVKKNDLILSAQNLHLGNANVNLRFEHGIISPAYKVYELIDSEPNFIQAWVKRHETKNFFLAATTEGASQCRKNIEWVRLYKQTMFVPAYKEQEAIGTFSLSLDNLITLQLRELELLKDTKKSLLQKMFPKDGANVPEIRFAGFTDAWEQRKFSETFIYLQNNSLSRADLNYEQGLVKNVHYGDVLIKFGEILDVEKAEIPFISNNEFYVSSASLLQNGDVVIADAAEDETVGKCSEIKGVDGVSIVSGLHTIPCRPSKTFATGYLGYYMNSSAYQDQLLPLIQGTKISSISKSALQNTNIIYPDSEKEQLQIGQFFQNLDHLITLHQCELNSLKNLKKSLIQQMFV